MSVEQMLKNRSNNECELCKATTELSVYQVPPVANATTDNSVLICSTCKTQLEKKAELDSNHWQCLNESMWSEVPAVQVVSWRMLNRFKNESWAADKIDMMYLDEEHLEWAKKTGDHEADAADKIHRDAYGVLLLEGDTVVLTQNLDVKGTSFSAKLGTVVKNIRLVADNHEQIEGKIENQTIVILTKYVRKK
ncbi:MAG: PhnA domain-containing protein [Sphingobacteriia bacterium]|nr:PhnA domain-containing protein [Sphingobacteriia bacterium]